MKWVWCVELVVYPPTDAIMISEYSVGAMITVDLN